MTNREAIEILKSNKPTSGYILLQEAIDKAIEALEEADYVTYNVFEIDELESEGE